MLQFNSPRVPLRIRNTREVWNSVYFEKISLLKPDFIKEHLSLIKHNLGEYSHEDLCQWSPSLYASPSKVIKKYLGKLYRELSSLGFLPASFSAQDFREAVETDACFIGTQGANFHLDIGCTSWHKKLFTVYALEDSDCELLFPNIGVRVPLDAGTLVVFDPAQPHGVVRKGGISLKKSLFSTEHQQTFIGVNIPLDAHTWSTLGVQTDLSPSQERDLHDAFAVTVGAVSGRLTFER